MVRLVVCVNGYGEAGWAACVMWAKVIGYMVMWVMLIGYVVMCTGRLNWRRGEVLTVRSVDGETRWLDSCGNVDLLPCFVMLVVLLLLLFATVVVVVDAFTIRTDDIDHSCLMI